MKMPDTLGACIDHAYELQQKYLEQKHKADAIAKQVSEVEEYIIATFPKAGLHGGKGALASATILTSVEPSVQDWDSVFKYVQKKKAWDLMYRRLNSKAFRDRLEEGEVIPGVEKFNRVKLSIRKIGD